MELLVLVKNIVREKVWGGLNLADVVDPCVDAAVGLRFQLLLDLVQRLGFRV